MGFFLSEQSTDQESENRPAAGLKRMGQKIPYRGPTGNPILSTKYWDADTKLSYYGYRFYGPGVGRWLSRDPLEERGGLGLYAFAVNAPVQRIDPYGLAAVEGGDCVICTKCEFEFFVDGGKTSGDRISAGIIYVNGYPKGDCVILSKQWYTCTWFLEDIQTNKGTAFPSAGWKTQEKLDNEFPNPTDGMYTVQISAKVEYLTCEAESKSAKGKGKWVRHWSTEAVGALFKRKNNKSPWQFSSGQHGFSQK